MTGIRRAFGLASITVAGVLAIGAAPAFASGFSYTDSTSGCQTYTVPSGYTTVFMSAVGANGAELGAGSPGSGGNVTGQAAVSNGQQLFVCVDVGGGAGGAQGGAGGGASGVSTGSDFSSPLIVAGGGGGNGAGGWNAGDAGLPAGGTGDGWTGFGGGGGTQSSGGAGGYNSFGGGANSGQSGSGYGAAGPGAGGAGGSAGGGGGGGYYGGGSGAANTGGGGGSDYCASSVSSCSATLASSSPSVTIWYPTSQTITFPATAVTYGQADFSPASSSSGLAVTYTNPSGQCSIDGSGLVQITGAGSCSVTANQAGNAQYLAATPATQTFVVDKATVHVDGSPASAAYGQPDPVSSGTLRSSDFVNGDTASVVSGTPSCSVGAHSPDAGTYAGAITCQSGTLAAANYTFATGAPAALTITPAVIHVDANPIAETYGQPDPVASGMLRPGDFVNGDTVSVVSGAPNCSIASHSPNPGTYEGTVACLPGTLSAANYTFAAGNAASLTITQRAPDISELAVSGSLVQEQTLTVTGQQQGVTYTYQWEDCDTAATNCNPIPGAVDAGYTLTDSDVGSTIRVQVTATDVGGTGQRVLGPAGAVGLAPIKIEWPAPVSRAGATLDSGSEISCTSGGPSCKVTARVTVTLGGDGAGHERPRIAHTLTIGTETFSVAAGQSAAGIIRISRLGLELLSDHSQLPVKIEFTGGPEGATPSTTSKTVMLAGRKAHLKVARIVTHRNGSITVKVKVSGPGRIQVMATAWSDNVAAAASALQPAANRFVVARASTVATRAGELTLHLHPNANGRRLIERPSYPVTLRLWVSYDPPYATQTNIGFFGLHL